MGCRIEVMTCSCRVKIIQINAADKLARARLFIHYFVRTEIWKRKDKTRRSIAYSAEAFLAAKCMKIIALNHCRNVCVTLCLIKEMSAEDV